jgi:hypothetical protein
MAEDYHPAYTLDTRLQCGAAADGGNHTCNCVYRRTICDESWHLCLCGNAWRSDTGCTCATTREKESPMTNVNVEITVTQGEYSCRVAMEAEVQVSPGGVANVQLERATKAMRALLAATTSSDDDDDDDDDDDY